MFSFVMTSACGAPTNIEPINPLWTAALFMDACKTVEIPGESDGDIHINLFSSG